MWVVGRHRVGQPERGQCWLGARLPPWEAASELGQLGGKEYRVGELPLAPFRLMSPTAGWKTALLKETGFPPSPTHLNLPHSRLRSPNILGAVSPEISSDHSPGSSYSENFQKQTLAVTSCTNLPPQRVLIVLPHFQGAAMIPRPFSVLHGLIQFYTWEGYQGILV